MGRIILTVLALAGIAGCAPAKRSPTHTPPATAGAGTILSMRTVNQFATAESVRASLLTGGSGRNDTTQALVEFIVRADDGATLSIVQPNDADLRTGDRVLVERGDQTRLAPLR